MIIEIEVFILILINLWRAFADTKTKNGDTHNGEAVIKSGSSRVISWETPEEPEAGAFKKLINKIHEKTAHK